ncbi:MAG: HAD family hydrolase [Rhizobiaceae bacterium]|nr:HAD family hydrolase [Rhizobiaceae bacterium]
MPQPELIIFDCDGVLVDSEIIAARVEAELLTQAGYAIEPEDIVERFAGLTFKDIMLRIEQVSNVPLQASLIEQSEELVDRRLRREVREIEGAGRAVAGVTVPHCICSNSRGDRLEFMLQRTGLLPLFSGRIFSSLETPSRNPKPAPDVFIYAAEKMGADPANTFVVEDSVHGIAGAKAAGMRVIGFTGASHTYPGHSEALTDAGAETVIRRWADFPIVVRALSEWIDA